MFENTIKLALSNFGLVMFALAIIASFLQWALDHKTNTYEIFFRWIAFLALGLTGIYAFIIHAFFPELGASTIGWANSPFQFEVAVANLGFGILAIFSFRATYGFRLATVLGNTCWLWGDAIGHIYQMITQHNFTLGNAGSWFWLDIIIPLALIICLIKLKPRSN